MLRFSWWRLERVNLVIFLLFFLACIVDWRLRFYSQWWYFIAPPTLFFSLCENYYCSYLLHLVNIKDFWCYMACTLVLGFLVGRSFTWISLFWHLVWFFRLEDLEFSYSTRSYARRYVPSTSLLLRSTPQGFHFNLYLRFYAVYSILFNRILDFLNLEISFHFKFLNFSIFTAESNDSLFSVWQEKLTRGLLHS